jgi:hypothetical protein
MSLLETNRAGSSKALGVYTVARCQKYLISLTGLLRHGDYIERAKVSSHLNVHGRIQTIGNRSDSSRYVNVLKGKLRPLSCSLFTHHLGDWPVTS